MADDVIGRVRAVALACETATEAVHLYGADKDGHARDLRRLFAVAEAARRYKVARAAVEEAKVWRETAQTTPSPNKGDAIEAAHRLLSQQTSIRDAALYELDAAVAAMGEA